MSRILMVRSPEILCSDNMVGYGWCQIDFSAHATTESLMAEFGQREIDIGRKGNQIRRFFNIGIGDLLVVPVPGSILMARANGGKSFEMGIPYGENRVGADFLFDNDGELLRYPRSGLSNALSTRLKVRSAIASLNEFSDELEGLWHSLQEKGYTPLIGRLNAKNAVEMEQVREDLLARIRSGANYLDSGGNGVEHLVKELLELEGYSVVRLGKRNGEGIADIDLIASRSDRMSASRHLVQVKHHNHQTGCHGINQLSAVEDDIEDETDLHRWLITTGSIDNSVREYASIRDVQIMDGEEFSEWLIERYRDLKESTRRNLWLSDAPRLLQPL